MRLLVDARYVRPVHDGISRYTVGLLQALEDIVAAGEEPGLQVAMLVSDRSRLADLPALPWAKGPSPTGPLEPLTGWWTNRYRPDVLFSPMQTVGSLGRRYGLVLTLHDLIYYDHPEPPSFLPAPVRWGWRLFHRSYAPQRFLLDRADAVATVSRTTRELMREHRLTRREVRVVANAAPPGSVLAPELALAAAEHRNRDLLYMGSAMPYKGVERLIEAMVALPEHRLRLLSRYDPRRAAQLEELARNRGVADRVVFHGGVEDAEYARLLRTCSGLVTASSAEGYGLPVVEAQAAGAPVLVSDIPIFREIAPHAVHLDFSDPGALARAVHRLEDPEAMRRTVLGGLADASRYDWADSARALVALARDVHEHRRRDRFRTGAGPSRHHAGPAGRRSLPPARHRTPPGAGPAEPGASRRSDCSGPPSA